jgi:uncharacterized protein involved in exopolysaccharide biosynthesis
MYGKPQSFISQSILLLKAPTSTLTPTQVVSILTSPIVLDQVVRNMGLGQSMDLESARKELSNQIKATVTKDELLRLDVSGKTPNDAQKIANALLDAWLKSTLPGETQRQILEERYADAQLGLKAVSKLLERIDAGTPVSQGQRLTRGEGGPSVFAGVELQARYLAESRTVSRELKGLPRDVIIQAPTLPIKPVPQKKVFFATISAVGTIFILLLFVLIREAWRTAAADQKSAYKQAKLLNALGIKATPAELDLTPKT